MGMDIVFEVCSQVSNMWKIFALQRVRHSVLLTDTKTNTYKTVKRA